MLKKIRKSLSNDSGFTLVELVVVIAILGILIALAIPQFGSVLKNSRAKSDLVNGSTIANAVNRAVANQEIEVTDTVVTVTTQTLVEKKYLQVEPKAKLIPKASFQASIDGDGKVVVTVGENKNDEVYPEPGGQYEGYADNADDASK